MYIYFYISQNIWAKRQHKFCLFFSSSIPSQNSLSLSPKQFHTKYSCQLLLTPNNLAVFWLFWMCSVMIASPSFQHAQPRRRKFASCPRKRTCNLSRTKWMNFWAKVRTFVCFNQTKEVCEQKLLSWAWRLSWDNKSFNSFTALKVWTHPHCNEMKWNWPACTESSDLCSWVK